jgi:hypothetical protein
VNGYRIITAQYPGQCGSCGEPFEAGEEVWYGGSGTPLAHETCGEPSDGDVAATQFARVGARTSATTAAERASGAIPPPSADPTGGSRVSVDDSLSYSEPTLALPPILAPTIALPLGAEQQVVYDCVMAGGNVLLSGPAGTGKSFLLERCVRDLRRQGKSVAVTASTGIAALNVGGSTIHSFLGTGIKDNVDDVQKHPPDLRRPGLENQILGAHVLVVDEVSMLTGDYVDMMDWWLAQVRQRRRERNVTPFGGLQVILCGDFLQLPPVQVPGARRAARLFAFEAACWEAANVRPFLLQQNFRQADGAFVDHLLRLRRGEVPNGTRDFFRPCVGRVLDKPTWLMARNDDAQRHNLAELAKLPGHAMRFEATYTGHETWQEALRKHCIAEPVLHLKPGAPVILLQNNAKSGIVNGMRATVLRASAKQGRVVVMLVSGREVELEAGEWEHQDATGQVLATMKQYPMKLAWALTIHKSQGLTLDRVWCDLAQVFEAGHAYVALSRVRTVEGLALARPLVGAQIRAHAKAIEFYQRWAVPA